MTSEDHAISGTSRRRFLIGSARLAAGAGLLSVFAAKTSLATPESMQAAIQEVIGEAQLRRGRISLDLPPLVENGNTVPVTVAVESPMTDVDHVKAIHVFNEKNPQPHVISVSLGPRAGKATFATRIKLADAQRVVAIAEMSDGSFWTESADVIVTVAACIEVIK
ncbi:MAG: SoxY-related AACIE arm protein [Proteobacteria bacterium]|nr:SoxY-related AACIE arm protein [Pseudomonadota bacterium]MBI3497435.1 SoxY-related AACIE arm protein [Pseudomonadota bacterium]